MNFIEKHKKKLNQNRKRGYSTIEAIFIVSTIILLFLVAVGFFTYLYPRQALEKQVHILAQQTKITGGLTYNQVTDFQSTVTDMGYKAKINAYVKGTKQVVLNVAPRGAPYSSCTNTNVYNPFVRRDSGQKMIITVTISANDGLLKGPLKFFGADMFPSNYVISETVLSERNRC